METLYVYNTLTRQKEKFTPIEEGKVKMYLCGPTVYDFGHLGHGRSAVSFDVIRRYLEYVYGEPNVTFVTNYTDIDDKMINRANEEGINVKELAEKIIPAYVEDYAALGIKLPTVQTKATDYITEMIAIIQKLEGKGLAYQVEDGLYFDLESFEGYGKLSKQNIEELREGARVEVNDQKKHPHDFALWKLEKPGEPAWLSPWGRGRPGWHIECSAMSRTELGQPFDIHGGGADLTFPHHEDEIAQSEGAFNVPFCRYWIHNGFITVNEEKMSKSLGNFFTLRDIFKKFNPRAVRYLFLSTHYRSPIEFSDGLLTQAENTLERVRDFLVNLINYEHDGDYPEIEQQLLFNFKNDFESSMNDDFDTVGALAAFFTLIKEINKKMTGRELSTSDAKKIHEAILKADTVFNILPELDQKLGGEIEALIKDREEARERKDWARSDEIRDELLLRGIIVEDTPGGTVWKRA